MPICSPLPSTPYKHVDLSRLVATNKEPSTIVKSHTHRSEAIIGTFLNISVCEDIENRSDADTQSTWTTVHEIDDANFVPRNIITIPTSR